MFYYDQGDIIGLGGLAYKILEGDDNCILHTLRREAQISSDNLQHPFFTEKLTRWILSLNDPI